MFPIPCQNTPETQRMIPVNEMGTKTKIRGYPYRWLLTAITLCTFFPGDTHAQIGNNMISIPAGKFVTSAKHGPKEMFIDQFFIDRFEVTQETYEKIIGINPSFFKGRRRPVEKVNWFEAVEYCRRVDKRLPSEWEWEKAARAESLSKFYWGDEDAKSHGWFKENSEKKTHPVGQKKPNSYGLHDMSGNVWEWTNSYRETTGGKVLRGGSWRNSMNTMRSSNWITSLPVHRFHYVGFRCARSKKKETHQGSKAPGTTS